MCLPGAAAANELGNCHFSSTSCAKAVHSSCVDGIILKNEFALLHIHVLVYILGMEINK